MKRGLMMKSWRLRAVAMVLLTVFASSGMGLAQNEIRKTPWWTAEGDRVVFHEDAANPEGPLLYNLIRLTGAVQDIHFIVPSRQDYRQLSEVRVGIDGRYAVPNSELESFLHGVLRANGFGVVPRGSEPLRLVEIVRLVGSGLQSIKSEVPYVDCDGLEPYRDRRAALVVTVYPLRHADPVWVARRLEQSILRGALLSGAAPLQGKRKAVMIVGFAPKVFEAVDLLRDLDNPDSSLIPLPAAQNMALRCEVWRVTSNELMKAVGDAVEKGRVDRARDLLLAAKAGASGEARFFLRLSEQDGAEAAHYWQQTEDGKPVDYATELAADLVRSDFSAHVVEVDLEIHRAGLMTRFSSKLVLDPGRWRLLRAGSSASDGGAVLAFLRVPRS